MVDGSLRNASIESGRGRDLTKTKMAVTEQGKGGSSRIGRSLLAAAMTAALAFAAHAEETASLEPQKQLRTPNMSACAGKSA